MNDLSKTLHAVERGVRGVQIRARNLIERNQGFPEGRALEFLHVCPAQHRSITVTPTHRFCLSFAPEEPHVYSRTVIFSFAPLGATRHSQGSAELFWDIGAINMLLLRSKEAPKKKKG